MLCLCYIYAMYKYNIWCGEQAGRRQIINFPYSMRNIAAIAGKLIKMAKKIRIKSLRTLSEIIYTPYPHIIVESIPEK